MEWSKLLSTEKLFPIEREPEAFGKFPISEFERDYNKIVASAAFRRLQDKTQVFPLDKSDFVRTRLTHSIEVSTIARQLGLMISTNKTNYCREEMTDRSEDISSILLCAGLLHDLGNPPFGHFGETTIGEWFKTNLDKILYKEKPLRAWLNDQMQKDLEHFEGNAQALRILSKAAHGSEINISYAIISTLVKYPVGSVSVEEKSPNICKHKLGHYLAEEQHFHSISETVGTLNAQGEICRHPLAFFLEAADDVAYATADLEDAFRKSLFTLDELLAYWGEYLSDESLSTAPQLQYSLQLVDDLNQRRSVASDQNAFRAWVHRTRQWLMYVAVYAFSKNYDLIMGGLYPHDLFYNTNHCISIRMLKDTMEKYVFHNPAILKLELSSQTILSFLLDKFVNAAIYYDCPEQEKTLTKANQKYLDIFSSNYLDDYRACKTGNEQIDLYLRLLMVTDYISGMTDTFARTLYRELSGIE